MKDSASFINSSISILPCTLDWAQTSKKQQKMQLRAKKIDSNRARVLRENYIPVFE